MRLEAEVDDTCIPPYIDPEGGGGGGAPSVVAAAATRRLWRALKLLKAVGEWAELLAVGALQELAASVLTQHVLPFLRVHLQCRSSGPQRA